MLFRRSKVSRKQVASRRSSRRHVPLLEALEDRCVMDTTVCIVPGVGPSAPVPRLTLPIEIVQLQLQSVEPVQVNPGPAKPPIIIRYDFTLPPLPASTELIPPSVFEPGSGHLPFSVRLLGGTDSPDCFSNNSPAESDKPAAVFGSSVFPFIVAGDAGRVATIFYGTSPSTHAAALPGVERLLKDIADAEFTGSVQVATGEIIPEVVSDVATGQFPLGLFEYKDPKWAPWSVARAMPGNAAAGDGRYAPGPAGTILAREVVSPSVIVVLNHGQTVDDPELLELFELELREFRHKYEFPAEKAPIIGGNTAANMPAAGKDAQTRPFLMSIEDVFSIQGRGTLKPGRWQQDRSTSAVQDGLQKRIAALIGQLGDEDPGVRERAAAELEKIGRPAAGALKKASEDPDPERRAQAQAIRQKLHTPTTEFTEWEGYDADGNPTGNPIRKTVLDKLGEKYRLYEGYDPDGGWRKMTLYGWDGKPLLVIEQFDRGGRKVTDYIDGKPVKSNAKGTGPSMSTCLPAVESMGVATQSVNGDFLASMSSMSYLGGAEMTGNFQQDEQDADRTRNYNRRIRQLESLIATLRTAQAQWEAFAVTLEGVSWWWRDKAAIQQAREQARLLRQRADRLEIQLQNLVP